MYAFACPVCEDLAEFESDRRRNCRAAIAFHLPSKSMVAILDDAMGKNPLYPFKSPPPVVAELGSVHRVIREAARTARSN